MDIGLSNNSMKSEIAEAELDQLAGDAGQGPAPQQPEQSDPADASFAGRVVGVCRLLTGNCGMLISWTTGKPREKGRLFPKL
jgi:hypothetical protein